jgi:hypothetical protein
MNTCHMTPRLRGLAERGPHDALQGGCAAPHYQRATHPASGLRDQRQDVQTTSRKTCGRQRRRGWPSRICCCCSGPQVAHHADFTIQHTSAAGRNGHDRPSAIRYWITSSAVANSVSGIVRPRALAVLRLIDKNAFRPSSDGALMRQDRYSNVNLFHRDYTK